MLDVHVLITNPRHDWVEQCKASIAAAMARAGFPVDVHYLAGVHGHIGRGRARGYALGAHPYVTCVDDDDYVLPWAFEQMREALGAGAPGLYTPETLLRNGYFEPGYDKHHLVVYRRAQIIDHTQWPCCGDLKQLQALGADAVRMPERGYVHRVYSDSAARGMRRKRPSEVNLARMLEAA